MLHDSKGSLNLKTKRSRWFLVFAAWLIAVTASLGALFIGEIMGQAPCSLCWYQRAFMFPLAIILGVAALDDDSAVTSYGLPLAVLGWLVATYHSLLYFRIIPEAIVPCTAFGPSCSTSSMTVLDGVPIPLLSVLSFTLISALLLMCRRRQNV